VSETELSWIPAVELAELVRCRQVSPLEIAHACLDRVAAVNPALNAIVHHDPEQVLRDARKLTDDVTSGLPLGPLHGVPYTLKEAAVQSGTPASECLTFWRDRVLHRDDLFTARLARAGGLFLGKTNMPEAAYSAASTNSLYGPTHNAWRHGMTAGGSSSGAGSAVAAGLGQLAQGSDGAGSLRIPASLNGVVGFKPSLGRVPYTEVPARYGTSAVIGPMSRTVADSALMLDVMAGPDPQDPMSLPDTGARYLDSLTGSDSLRGLRIAYSPTLGFADTDPEIAAVCETAARVFEDLGCTVELTEPNWPDPETAMWHSSWAPAYAPLVAEPDWKTWASEVTPEFAETVEEAARTTAVDIGQAESVRGRMWDVYADFTRTYDLLLSPVVASHAFPATEVAPAHLAGQPIHRRLLGWLLTYPFNMLGVPAISVPAGHTTDRMPVGLQIAGGWRADSLVLRAAAAFEQARPWARHRPQAR
jgi:aspartyl-tRNA(Asn)/glutamyl-tRNA(Gln) amidotransferase subunit A